MNMLPTSKKIQIISMLVEGMSLRDASRIGDVSINTVTKLLIDTGIVCQNFHNEIVQRVNSIKIKAEETWSFVSAKEKNVPRKMKGNGDIWTWTGIDTESKLIVSWFVGERNAESAYIFICEMKSRLKTSAQLTIEDYKVYLNAVPEIFGSRIDYGMLIQNYGEPSGLTQMEEKYGPSDYTGFKEQRGIKLVLPENTPIWYVEHQNLPRLMHMRRYTHLKNAFSKKIENHCCAIALHFVYYNFVKIHKTLGVTPAMEAGLTKDVMTIEEIVKLAD